MVRRYLVVMLLIAIAANLVFFTANQSRLSKAHISQQEIMTVDKLPAKPQIVEATSRLLYHSKMVALESLIVTKHSINLMFDIVIKAL